MDIIVETIPVSYQDHKNYAYLVFDRKTGDGIIIDAAFDSDKIKGAISRSNVSIRAVLVTHHHSDHSGGNGKFIATAQIVSTANARANIVEHKQSNAT